MAAADTNAYFRTKVMTASPAELRMMLLDGAHRFALQARDSLQAANHEQTYAAATRCQDILMELISGLDRAQAPELCSRLASLYTYLYIQMLKATSERNWKLADEVVGLLKFECDTWQLVMDKLKSENIAASDLQHTPAVDPPRPPAASSPAHSLVGGTVSFKA